MVMYSMHGTKLAARQGLEQSQTEVDDTCKAASEDRGSHCDVRRLRQTSHPLEHTLTSTALASSSLMAGTLGVSGCGAGSVVGLSEAGCSILTYGPGGGTAATASSPYYTSEMLTPVCPFYSP